MKQYMLTNEDFLDWFKKNTAAGKAGREASANDPETLREALNSLWEGMGQTITI